MRGLSGGLPDCGLKGHAEIEDFDMTVVMSFMPPTMRLACRSELMVSGQNPCRVAGSARL